MILADATLAFNATNAHGVLFYLGVAALIGFLGWVGRTMRSVAQRVHEMDRALSGTGPNRYAGEVEGTPGLGQRLAVAEAHDVALYEADARQRAQIEAIAEQLLTENHGSTLKAAVTETREKVKILEAGQGDTMEWIEAYGDHSDANIEVLRQQGITGLTPIPKLKRSRPKASRRHMGGPETSH